MQSSKIPSPSRSLGAPITPRRNRPRRTRSVASPALSTASGRLTSVIEHFKENNMESFAALSPLNSRRSVLTDNTDIEEPGRRSWWKNLKENSRDVMEVLEDNNVVEDNQAIEELIDIEVLSQEKKNFTLDLPESSGSESISSIVLPQRKLFTHKDERAKIKFGQFVNTRGSIAKQKRNTTSHDKTLTPKTKTLFRATKKTKPIFPAALLNITPNKTIADKSKELPAEPKQTKNIFGNRPMDKRKNMFANFIISDSEDEISEIQPKVFGFQKKVDQVRGPEPRSSNLNSDRDMDENNIFGNRPMNKRKNMFENFIASDSEDEILEIQPKVSSFQRKVDQVRGLQPRSSNLNSDIEMDDWKHLPSSTMVEHQLEEMIRGQTPVKRARLESQEKEPQKIRKSVSKSFAKIQENVIDENMDESLENKQYTAVELIDLLQHAVEDDVDKEIEDFVENQKNEDDAIVGPSLVENKEIVKNAVGNESYKNAATRQENEIKDVDPEHASENLKEQDSNDGANENGDKDDAMDNPDENKENIGQKVSETKDFQDGKESDNEHKDQAAVIESQIIKPQNKVSGKISPDRNADENDNADGNNEVESSRDVIKKAENDANVNVNDDKNYEEHENESSHETDFSANQSNVEDDADEANESDIENDQQENEVSANECQVEDDANEANESEQENEVSANESQVDDDAKVVNESDVENDQQIEDSDDADKAMASDETEPDDEQIEEEDSQELKYESDVDENREQNESTVEIEVTPNTTHDTTGRNRKKPLDKSPEVILHDKTNLVESFTVQGNNTSITKTMSKSLNIRPSMAPPRESTGYSTEEGSGWDSHRTTRKTIRQTFGKDFTVRKSLRALVMEKSAARQTEHMQIQSETVKFPQANSTELPEQSNWDVDEIVEGSDHEVSIGTRRNILEMHLQRIKQENMVERLKIREQVRNSIKAPTRDPLNIFIVPTKPPPRQRKPSQKKPINTVTPFGNLPQEVIEDLKYKPPKRFRPANASWITKRLYKFLETKLESKYDYKARVRAEKLVETIYNFVKDIRRHKTAPGDAIDALKYEMARLDIVKTHFEFYEFFHEYMPREVRIKVNPDIVNNIPLPRNGVFADIQCA